MKKETFISRNFGMKVFYVNARGKMYLQMGIFWFPFSITEDKTSDFKSKALRCMRKQEESSRQNISKELPENE